MELVKKEKSAILTVDLSSQTIEGEGQLLKFEIDNYRKERLLSGQDDIGQTLKKEDQIKAYEKSHAFPWQAVLPGFGG
jgi:3-isopropylmalate/(R)-2-methylmalate dehydratase small subunit